MPVERIPLDSMSPGSSKVLTVFRFGSTGGRPKAYLQAAMHADEPPGILALHHLCRRLAVAESEGRVLGEVVVVPVANPIGLDQVANGVLLGRYDLRSTENFNRNWPDVTARLMERIKDELGPDPDANIVAVRRAMGPILAETKAVGALAQLRLALLKLAYDADIAIDIHCDDEAEPYLMALERTRREARDLAADLGVPWLLLERESDNSCFDDTLSRPWILAGRLRGEVTPVPLACLAVTLELRGAASVDDALNARDAEGLFRYLARRGVVRTDPGPAPIDRVRLARTSAMIDAPRTGLLVHKLPLGAFVRRGDLVAELIDPGAEDQATARTPVAAPISGHIVSRRLPGIVAPGDFLIMILSDAAEDEAGTVSA